MDKNKYTITQFRNDFPNDDVCLDYIFNKKYPQLKAYRIHGRKDYADASGKQYSPLADTIFEKSSTKLTSWFHAIYLFSVSKNGVSAKELERQLGVTYKTAWRMAKQIRSLMDSGDDLFTGTIEADETYIGGYRKGGQGGRNKTPVLGLVQRFDKRVRAIVARRESHLVLNNIRDNVFKGSAIMSDQFGVYKKVKKLGYEHDSVNHWKREYGRGKVHTNTIEGFWAQLKRGLLGTYNGAISSDYLQLYVNEFSFRYCRSSPEIFARLLGKI
jgi:transposase